VPELARSGTLSFQVHRSNSTLNDVAQAPVTMKNGRVTVTLDPLDLVTLRSAGIKARRTMPRM